MRKALLMAGALLAMTSTLAFAVPGVDLAWNACIGQTGAAETRTSACASNTGSQSMFASFNPPAGIQKLEGIEVFIDYQVGGGAMPCWWNFSVGMLRASQLTALHVSPTDIDGNPLVACGDHYFLANGAAGGGGMVVTGADRGQMRGIAAIAAGSGLPVTADVQQYGWGARVANGSTTPAGTCDGCAQPVCFVVNTINLTSLGVPNVVLQSPGTRNYITWQGTPVATNCPGATPTRNATWGSVKALYR